ncbi:MAG: ATP-binding cassette domain-containing protein [Minwuia sp.]|nr:ATP-binding cassette domain-containing protein [Minwuia sp.]
MSDALTTPARRALAPTKRPAGVLPVALEAVSYRADAATLLDQVSFRLRPGRLTTIMGPNGAGKTLCLRLIQGLLRPDDGQITYATAPISDAGRRRIATVFQRPVLLRRSVIGNLRHALRVYGIPRRDRPAMLAELLQLAGLSDVAHRSARVLSAGEQQRLSIVRALAAEPDLLLLDEPTANLDPYATRLIETLIGTAEARGATVVLVTHDVGQARRLADDVIFLNRGRVMEQAAASDFFDGPATDAAAAYLAGRLLL